MNKKYHNSQTLIIINEDEDAWGEEKTSGSRQEMLPQNWYIILYSWSCFKWFHDLCIFGIYLPFCPNKIGFPKQNKVFSLTISFNFK